MYDVDFRYQHIHRLFTLHDLSLDSANSIAKESQCAFSVEETLERGLTAQMGGRYRRFLMGKKSIGDNDVDVMSINMEYYASCLESIYHFHKIDTFEIF